MARELFGPDEYIATGHATALNAIGLDWVMNSTMRRGDPLTDADGIGGNSSISGNGASSAVQNTSPTFRGGSGGRELAHFFMGYRVILEDVVSVQNAVSMEWYHSGDTTTELGSVEFTGDSGLIKLYTGASTLVATSGEALLRNVVYHIDVEVLIADASGYIKVWVNDSDVDVKSDTPFVEFTGDTKPGSETAIASVGVFIGKQARWDDFRLNSITMRYDGGVGGAPAAGETVTDGTTGATAVITAVEGNATSGVLVLANWDGTAFGNNNAITTGGTFNALVDAPTGDFVNGFEPNSGALGPGFVKHVGWSGNGTTSQLTGSDADSVDNYLHTDEEAPSDGNYVEGTTTGEYDTYATDDLPAGVDTIRCIQPWALAHSDLLGIDDMQFATRMGGSDRFHGIDGTSGTNIPLPASEGFVAVPLNTHPDGSTGAITPAVFNASEFGWKVI